MRKKLYQKQIGRGGRSNYPNIAILISICITERNLSNKFKTAISTHSVFVDSQNLKKKIIERA